MMWPIHLITAGNIWASISGNGWGAAALGILVGTPDGGNSSWSALPRSFLTGSELTYSKYDLKINTRRVICCSNTAHCLQTAGWPNPCCFLCCRYKYLKADQVTLLFAIQQSPYQMTSTIQAKSWNNTVWFRCPACILPFSTSTPLLRMTRHHHISLTGIPNTSHFCIAIPW